VKKLSIINLIKRNITMAITEVKSITRKTYKSNSVKILLKNYTNLYLPGITFLNLNKNNHFLSITNQDTISKEIYIHRDNEVDSIVQTLLKLMLIIITKKSYKYYNENNLRLTHERLMKLALFFKEEANSSLKQLKSSLYIKEFLTTYFSICAVSKKCLSYLINKKSLIIIVGPMKKPSTSNKSFFLIVFCLKIHIIKMLKFQQILF
jgi:hypothetical protein